jgi:hypothetical protein
VKLVVLILGVASVLIMASGATAKEFRPGSLRICTHQRCVPINNPRVLELLGAFYYTGRSPAKARSPRLGARAFQLQFENGYVTGVVAGAKLDRFLSYGVDLGRFAPRQWYRFPQGVAQELRTLAAPLNPLHLTRRMLARSS